MHDDGDVKTGRWQSRVPFAVAGFNLGEYKVETAAGDHPKVELYANQQLENAILALLQKNPADNTSLPGLFQLPRQRGLSGNDSRGADAESCGGIETLGGGFTDSVRFFERLNGPFPFDHLDVSADSGKLRAGMARDCCIYRRWCFSPNQRRNGPGSAC